MRSLEVILQILRLGRSFFRGSWRLCTPSLVEHCSKFELGQNLFTTFCSKFIIRYVGTLSLISPEISVKFHVMYIIPQIRFFIFMFRFVILSGCVCLSMTLFIDTSVNPYYTASRYASSASKSIFNPVKIFCLLAWNIINKKHFIKILL